jgi:hypothetical protein
LIRRDETIATIYRQEVNGVVALQLVKPFFAIVRNSRIEEVSLSIGDQ